MIFNMFFFYSKLDLHTYVFQNNEWNIKLTLIFGEVNLLKQNDAPSDLV